MPKDLKLRATLDATDVGAGARRAVKEIDGIAAASDRAKRSMAGLATAPVDLNAPAGSSGAAPRAYPDGSSRVRFAGNQTRFNFVEGRDPGARGPFGGRQIRGLGALERFAGATGIESTVNLVRSLPALIGGLSAATIAAGAGITAALVPVYIAFTQYKKLVDLKNQTTEALSANIAKQANFGRDEAVSAIKSGALRGTDGENIVKEFDQALLRRKQLKDGFDRADNLPGSNKPWYAKQLEKQEEVVGEIYRRMEKMRQVSYETEHQGAEAAAQSKLATDTADNAAQQKRLDQMHQSGLLSKEKYLKQSSALIDRQTDAEKEALSVREKDLRETLSRQTDDVEAAAKTRIALEEVVAQKSLVTRKGRFEKESLIQSQDVAGPAFRAQAVGVDDLARIGLFRGGGGESQVSFLRQQLAEAKEANRILRLVQTGIGNL